MSDAIPASSLILMVRSLLFSAGMIISTIPWASLVLLAFPLSFERRYRIAQYWSRFNIWWLKITCAIDYQITGLEHIPTKPAIVICKHQSAWETIFLQQFLPPLSWVVKRELLWVPFFGWALALLNPISINRKAINVAVRQVVRQGKRNLDRGQWILIFPEGTRTAPGHRRPYGIGGAMLAVRSGYPVLPVAHNAGEFWPRRGFLKRPGTVRLVFGPLIQSSGHSIKELNTLVETWIEETMKQISSDSTQQMKTEADKIS